MLGSSLSLSVGATGWMTKWAGSRVGMWAAAAVISGKTDRPAWPAGKRQQD